MNIYSNGKSYLKHAEEDGLIESLCTVFAAQDLDQVRRREWTRLVHVFYTRHVVRRVNTR